MGSQQSHSHLTRSAAGMSILMAKHPYAEMVVGIGAHALFIHRHACHHRRPPPTSCPTPRNHKRTHLTGSMAGMSILIAKHTYTEITVEGQQVADALPSRLTGRSTAISRTDASPSKLTSQTLILLNGNMIIMTLSMLPAGRGGIADRWWPAWRRMKRGMCPYAH